MSEVECITLDGHTKKFQSNQLTLRPAVYAIIISDGKLLLLKMIHTGKYHLPGGGVNIGEHLLDTLKREVDEETGIEIGNVKFAYFEELFFYYDPSGKAYHGLHFYFVCRTKSIKLLADEQVKDGSAQQPRWVKIKDLKSEDFQIHGDVVLGYCKKVTAQYAAAGDLAKAQQGDD